ncbi:protein ECT2 [Schistocerca piceifrons]|uniref:protein ECT2 n=1 Tax=Schistocerca piceifrons TaxID=274613 RepID=UPI001F5FAB8B|nr:protein ECT2 [Schistocerca piceifrons]XP_049951648.1 protein ECT2 isoform X5 [Schistocerca serialis cubense]
MDEAAVCLADVNFRDPLTVCTRICLVGDVRKDSKTTVAAEKFGIPVVESDSGSEFLNDGTCDTVFITNDFSGSAFEAIHRSEQRIMGPTALQECAEKGDTLPHNTRPLYCHAMAGLVVCFTGFRKKDELNRMITLIHNMGGSIRKDMVAKVTHLIANNCGGEKYRYAVTFRVPIMSDTWVYKCWEQRDKVGFSAVSDEMMCHKMKPFVGARVCFYGFPDEERQHMTEILLQNGGEVTDVEDGTSTHVVVDESNVQSVPDLTINAPIVKAEWFWKSVQNEAQADEKEHLFEDYLETAQSPAGWRTSQGTPSSTASVRARKRKRLRDVASRLLQQNESPAIHKRRSSVSDAGLLSMSGSFLDSCSATPDKQDEVEAVLSETPRKNLSPRQQVFFELLQTESNYVGILDTIMTLFKSPLEDVSEQGGALLNNTELKIIFGNLPPIYEVHKQMLEELRSAAASWKEEISIGKIFLKYVPDLVKAYPPFVNFFENTKEMLVMCDQTKPRFHAFLKICQTKPECGRQSLQELLIRPVQRLPSISLLLNDILKHTSKSNPDHAALEKAIASIREVMTHINEDKRKTEGQLVMFDIFNDIDNCPPHLVSSHRSFIVRCDVMELSDGLSGRGDNLVFFLFSDTMEVCKKRSKTFNSLKSPNTSSLHSAKMSSVKPFKHVRLMPLTHIKRVIDIRETDECHNVFALMCRSNQELKDKLYSFTIADEETEKLGFLRTLCRQMANTVCKTDAENFLMSLDSHQLDIDTSDVALGTLSKAFKFASRTRMKVGRAFSFNKTPSKLKRAVSTMMSPFGSTTNLTPASQLAQMRLASCNNLNELGSSPSKEETTLVAPLSVQPTRKNKSSSLNMSSLRRL